MLDIFKRTYNLFQNPQLEKNVFIPLIDSIAESFHAQEDSFFYFFNEGLFEVKCPANVRYVVF
jgi:hypothetical protein